MDVGGDDAAGSTGLADSMDSSLSCDGVAVSIVHRLESGAGASLGLKFVIEVVA